MTHHGFYMNWLSSLEPYITTAYISYSPCTDPRLSELYASGTDLLVLAELIQSIHKNLLSHIPTIGIFVDVSTCFGDSEVFSTGHVTGAKFWFLLEQFGIDNNIQVMFGPAFSNTDQEFDEWWRDGICF